MCDIVHVSYKSKCTFLDYSVTIDYDYYYFFFLMKNVYSRFGEFWSMFRQ